MSLSSPPTKSTLKGDDRPDWLKKSQFFLSGGLAGCVATCCIQPIDMVKVRLQLLNQSSHATVVAKNTSPIVMATHIIKNEGFFSLYKGLDAGLIRQITYSTMRLGLFRVISDCLKSRHIQKHLMLQGGDDNTFSSNSTITLPLYQKAFAGLTAGCIASFFGNPADLALVRLQADKTLDVKYRRNYKNIFDAIIRIVREEGFFALWKGACPTVLRAMSLNMGMLASYDQSKEFFNKQFTHFVVQNDKNTDFSKLPTFTMDQKTITTCSSLLASGVSGIFAVLFSLPFDFLKTRIQNMQSINETTRPNFIKFAIKIMRTEGIRVFYTALPTYYFRIAPHAMITLTTMDFINHKIFEFYN